MPATRLSRMARLACSLQRWATGSPARCTIASRPVSACAGAGSLEGCQPTSCGCACVCAGSPEAGSDERSARAREADSDERHTPALLVLGSRVSTVTSSPRAVRLCTSALPDQPAGAGNRDPHAGIVVASVRPDRAPRTCLNRRCDRGVPGPSWATRDGEAHAGGTCKPSRGDPAPCPGTNPGVPIFSKHVKSERRPTRVCGLRCACRPARTRPRDPPPPLHWRGPGRLPRRPPRGPRRG